MVDEDMGLLRGQRGVAHQVCDWEGCLHHESERGGSTEWSMYRRPTAWCGHGRVHVPPATAPVAGGPGQQAGEPGRAGGRGGVGCPRSRFHQDARRTSAVSPGVCCWGGRIGLVWEGRLTCHGPADRWCGVPCGATCGAATERACIARHGSMSARTSATTGQTWTCIYFRHVGLTWGGLGAGGETWPCSCVAWCCRPAMWWG